jgi:predicted nucleic acid-binding protein
MRSPTDVVFDTNILVDWLNRRAHEEIILGAGIVRYMSAVVLMELRVGAGDRRSLRVVDQLSRQFTSAGRVIAPTPKQFDEAGTLLRRLKSAGREIRRASLVNDLLIALSARRVGATLYTQDRDFESLGHLVGIQVVFPPKPHP